MTALHTVKRAALALALAVSSAKSLTRMRRALHGDVSMLKWLWYALAVTAVLASALPTAAARASAGYSFNEYPGGFRPATFYPENALTGFHNWLWLAAFQKMERWIGLS